MARITRGDILRDFRTRSLLEATRRIIATQGFDAVTMEQVGKRAGITKAAIYLYFRDKDQLVLAAIEEMIREAEPPLDPEASPWDQLRQLVQGQMEMMERHGELLRALLLDRRIASDSLRRRQSRRILRWKQRREGLVKKILDRGVQQGLFPPMDTIRAAFLIDQMTINTMQKRMLGLTRLPLAREARELIGFLSLLLRDQKAHYDRLEDKA